MHTWSGQRQAVQSRRELLVASAAGFAGLRFGRPQADASGVIGPGGGKAKSVILFFLCGGAPSRHLGHEARRAARISRAVQADRDVGSRGAALRAPAAAGHGRPTTWPWSIRSAATVNTNDHHAGYYYNLTGHVPDRHVSAPWATTARPIPTTGLSWARWLPPGGRSRNKLPQRDHAAAHARARKPYTRPGQFAARLGVEFDPLYLAGSREKPLKFQAPSLALQGRRRPRRPALDASELLQTIDGAPTRIRSHADRRRSGSGSSSGRSISCWPRHDRRGFDLGSGAGRPPRNGTAKPSTA